MSAIAARITSQHRPMIGQDRMIVCRGADCDDTRPFATHIAELTEQAVREQVARDIENQHSGYDHGDNEDHVMACVWEVATASAWIARDLP